MQLSGKTDPLVESQRLFGIDGIEPDRLSTMLLRVLDRGVDERTTNPDTQIARPLKCRQILDIHKRLSDVRVEYTFQKDRAGEFELLRLCVAQLGADDDI